MANTTLDILNQTQVELLQTYREVADNLKTVDEKIQEFAQTGTVANALKLGGKSLDEIFSIQFITKRSYISNHSGTDAWRELDRISLEKGKYLVFMSAHRIYDPEHSDPDSGQFGVFLENTNITAFGGGNVKTYFSGENVPKRQNFATNIVSLGEVMNNNKTIYNNSMLFLFEITNNDTLIAKSRTDDPDTGGLRLIAELVIYKIGG